MFCNKCGRELADGSAFCSGCGNRIDGGGSPNYLKTTFNAQQNTPNQQTYTPNNNMHRGGGENAGGGTFHCPRCKSTNLDIISSTEVNTSSKGGFSAGKGCLGFLCLGPLGILCGACSKSKVKTSVKTNTAWVCKNCAHRFKDANAFNEELDVAKNSAHMAKIGFLLSLFVFLGLEAFFLGATVLEFAQRGKVYLSSDAQDFLLIAGISCLMIIPCVIFKIMQKGAIQEISELEALKAETERNCYHG